MKIGIITEYYYPLLGGITEHVHHFAHEAKKIGHSPMIITSDAGTDPHIKPEVEVVKLGKSIPVYSNGSIAHITVGYNIGRRLKEIFRSEQFDIIHVHSPMIPTLPLLAQRHSNTVTIGTFHTQFDSSFLMRGAVPFLKSHFYGLGGRIAVSHLCIESMERYYPGGKYTIIPNGVDTDKFNGEAPKLKEFCDGKINIFFLSRLEPRNGLEYLIRAFVEIRKRRDDCRLIVGGDGPLKLYYKSLVPKALEGDVHFIGRIDGARPNYYSTADIFCFPTTKASFGITILEAMAAGKPVVAFTMPAYQNIIKSGSEGSLCGSFDSKNLGRALNELLDSPEKRRLIGAGAKLRAQEFSWHKITRQIVDYYEDIKGRG